MQQFAENLSLAIQNHDKQGRDLMIFDWVKAAQRIKETGAKYASAGLQGDWSCTCDEIFIDGEPVLDADVWETSLWAVPSLKIKGEVEPCFRMASDTPGWQTEPNWPQEALDILNAE